MSLKFWRKTPDPTQERIADALEKLVLLVTLGLSAQGLNPEPSPVGEEGEIYYENADPRDTRERTIAAAEAERTAALAEWERELARTDYSSTVWSGPEGAEDAALPL